MGAIVNGLAVHGGLRPYGSTFLIFSDYMRPSIRLSALMEAPSLWVFTHDSIWLGEDGPTHQPIEHIPSLRAIPNLWVIRPGDAGETVEAWEMALNRHEGPTALLLTRQGLPVLDRSGREGGVSRGAYLLRNGTDLSLWATGSELHLALEAGAALETERRLSVRVVSAPCLEAFALQPDSYKSKLMPDDVPTLFVEASRTVGSIGTMRPRTFHHLGLDRFGASAPGDDVARALGFTTEGVTAAALKLLDA
jgi:transketolase